MKNKVFRFLALCLFGSCLMPVHAEDKNILIGSDDAPDSRSIVQLPTATLENGSIEISFPYACISVITITDTTNGAVVLSGVHSVVQGNVVLNVSLLPTGKRYCLTIRIGQTTYYGYFEL